MMKHPPPTVLVILLLRLTRTRMINHPPTVTLVILPLLKAMGKTWLHGELEGAKQRIIERDERRSMCSDTKNVTLPHAKNATGPERRPSVIKRAGKRWGKLKAAVKVRQAMKEVQRNSKKPIKEDRDAIHNDIVKFFKTRLQKGDRLLAKTEKMGYDFGSLRSHVDFMYEPSGKLRFILDMVVFLTMVASFYTTVYLFAFVPEALNNFQWFVLYWSEVIYIFDAVHRCIVLYGSQHQPLAIIPLTTWHFWNDEAIFISSCCRGHSIEYLVILQRYGASSRYVCSVPQTESHFFYR